MILASKLKALWNSYQPMLKEVETASSASDLDVDLSRLEIPERLEILDLEQSKDGWGNQDNWQDAFLIGEIKIQYGDDKNLVITPRYKFDEGKVRWYAADQQPPSGMNLGRFVYDMVLNFKPRIKPDWQKDPTHHCRDYRFHESEFGKITTLLQDGKCSYLSKERREFINDEERVNEYQKRRHLQTILDDPMWKGYVPEEALRLARILAPNLCPTPPAQLLKLGFDNREPRPEEFGLIDFDDIRAGMEYLSKVKFRFEDLEEPGSVDDLLNHLGIRLV